MNNTQSVVTLQCASYMFRPQQGHPQGGSQCRNKRMASSIEDTHMSSPNITLYIKIATNIYNTDYLTNTFLQLFCILCEYLLIITDKHISMLSSFLGSYPFAVSRCLHNGASIGTLLFIIHVSFSLHQAWWIKRYATQHGVLDSCIRP